MRHLLCAALTWAAILVAAVGAAAQPDAARPTIHRITVDSSGVLTISGVGLSADLAVTVDGAPATILPGATATQMAVLGPPEVVTLAGTYRVTVLDAVRRAGDVFVVAGPAAPAVVVGGAPGEHHTATATSVRDWRTPVTTTESAAVAAGVPVGVSPSLIENANTAVGVGALFSNTSGIDNTATGLDALNKNTAGSYNTASGSFALFLNTTGFSNTASGTRALVSNTTGSNNTASGADALARNTTGIYNTATGSFALFVNTTGVNNTASGVSALYNNTDGSSNTASGMEALVYNTSGFFNTASGAQALYSNTTGATNTASGVSALYSNLSGDSNTAAGAGALFANTSGANNAALGYGAGHDATTGSFNLFLGAYVAGTAADTNTIRIGLPYDGAIGQNRTFIAGIHGTQLTGNAVQVFIDANGQLGTLTPPIVTGTGTVPVSQVQQQVSAYQQKFRDQEAVNADLRARIARLEALLLSAGRK